MASVACMVFYSWFKGPGLLLVSTTILARIHAIISNAEDRLIFFSWCSWFSNKFLMSFLDVVIHFDYHNFLEHILSILCSVIALLFFVLMVVWSGVTCASSRRREWRSLGNKSLWLTIWWLVGLCMFVVYGHRIMEQWWFYVIDNDQL